MAAEKAGHGHADRLSALGQVSTPTPEVLDAARDRLWAVVAAEMLGGAAQAPGAARRGDAARGDSGGAVGQRDVSDGTR